MTPAKAGAQAGGLSGHCGPSATNLRNLCPLHLARLIQDFSWLCPFLVSLAQFSAVPVTCPRPAKLPLGNSLNLGTPLAGLVGLLVFNCKPDRLVKASLSLCLRC